LDWFGEKIRNPLDDMEGVAVALVVSAATYRIADAQAPPTSGAMTRAPTPTTFLAPTYAPSPSPTYGPASMTIVETIIGSVLGGIIVLLVIYFMMGYWCYVHEMSLYEKSMDEKEKREEALRRRMERPHGRYFGTDETLIRAPNQVEVSSESGAGSGADEEDGGNAENKPLLPPDSGWVESNRA